MYECNNEQILEEMKQKIRSFSIRDGNWDIMQKWAMNKKREKGVTWNEFLTELDLPPKTTFIQYLSSFNVVPSKQENTLGYTLRESLTAAMNKNYEPKLRKETPHGIVIDDWYLENKQTFPQILLVQKSAEGDKIIVYATRELTDEDKQVIRNSISTCLARRLSPNDKLYDVCFTEAMYLSSM